VTCVCKTRKRNAIHLRVSGPVISLKAPYHQAGASPANVGRISNPSYRHRPGARSARRLRCLLPVSADRLPEEDKPCFSPTYCVTCGRGPSGGAEVRAPPALPSRPLVLEALEWRGSTRCVFVWVVFGACVSKRQIGERKAGRGDTVNEMIVGPRKAARAIYEKNDQCENKRGCCALFSQWSIRVSQQLGIFTFMATDHCENGLRFFSQWSGWVAPGFEPWRKTGFVTGPAER
jgi:hypothetical protein